MSALCFFFSLAGCQDDRQYRDVPLPPDAVILAVGDSLTYGSGAERTAAYPAQLARITGHRVVNRGIPGETTRQLLSRFEMELNQHGPQLVLLISGGNDFLHRLPEDKTREHLAAMLQMASRKGIDVVLVAVPKPSIFPKDHPLYEDLSQEYSVPLLSNVLTELLSEPSLKSDPIHLNEKGYRKLSLSLAASLQRWGYLPSTERLGD